MHSTALLCCMPCCCLRPHGINVQYCCTTCCCLRKSWYQCTAQYITALRHVAASDLMASVRSSVHHCSAQCCCLRLRCINVQYRTALRHAAASAFVDQCTVQHCFAACHAAASHLMVTMYSTATPYAWYQCTAQHITALRHAAGSRPERINALFSTSLLCGMLLPHTSLYQ